jgi:hypothetical protein
MSVTFVSTHQLSTGREHRSAVAGGAIWLTGVLLFHPTPFDVTWAHVLLVFAPLVLVPIGFDLVGGPSDRLRPAIRLVQLPSAVALGVAYLLPKGVTAAVLAVPWFATTVLISMQGLLHARRYVHGPVSELSIGAGVVYMGIGSGWAVLDRLGVRPLEFDEVIVLLTAIHFHYAGFVLPIVAGLLDRHLKEKLSAVTACGVILAVPIVAMGITATQLGFNPIWEAMAAWFLALCGIVVGWLLFKLAQNGQWPPLVCACWRVAGASLIASMILAAVYGTRFFAPVEWLDIPWMRALHGTASAFGFGLVGLVGWSLASRRATPQRSNMIGS